MSQVIRPRERITYTYASLPSLLYSMQQGHVSVLHVLSISVAFHRLHPQLFAISYLASTCSISFLSTVISLLPTADDLRSLSPPLLEPADGLVLPLRLQMTFAHCAAYVIAFHALHRRLVAFFRSLRTHSPIKTYTKELALNEAPIANVMNLVHNSGGDSEHSMTEVLTTPPHIATPHPLLAAVLYMGLCTLLVFFSQLVTVPLVISALPPILKPTTTPNTRSTDADQPGPAVPTDPTHARTPTYDTLTFSALNVGGVDIAPNRFCHLLAGYTRLPHTISLGEFCPSTASHLRDHEQVARYPGYHLLASSPDTRAGVALLIHTSIAPAKPRQRTHIPGRLVSCRLPLHTDPLMPHVTVASYYGPDTAKKQITCERHLDPLLKECSIVLRNSNAVTHVSHTPARRANIWPWLVAEERSTALTDLILPHFSEVPYTRLRRYHGTKSYIDWAYGSRSFASFFQSTAASVPDFSRVTGIKDHDPIVVHTIPWSTPHVPEAVCALWNRRDVSKYQRKLSALARDIPVPYTYAEVEHTYSLLTTHMLTAMREVNEQKPPPPRTNTDVTDWSTVVRQLAKQAKRRSKVCYRRCKNTLLTPPSQSTLPTPTRKIKRILQRNTPWSSTALDLVPQQSALPARAPRKKSPGPDGVPPYLLASLPDALFGIVHKCLTLCYESGSIPDPWLVSETFCIFEGKGQWQDPDRWPPIAMSNSIYRLLMRWVYHTLYPLIARQLHPKQFGGRQGSSTAHATQAFLQELEHMADKEAVLAFDVYHAFDSPQRYLILHTLLRMGTPARLLLSISLVLARGATFLRGGEDVVFTTTHGVKQGCCLSCFLFVIVFDIPLRSLFRNGVPLSAYVDDISSPAPTHAVARH